MKKSMRMGGNRGRAVMILTLLWTVPRGDAITIDLDANAALQANQGALDAFTRAAAQWERIITDDILVTIEAGLADLGSNVLGQASKETLSANYSVVRQDLIDDAANEEESSLFADLPATFGATLPTGFDLSGTMQMSKANYKALDTIDAVQADVDFGLYDATITFSSVLGFDYDNTDGVGPGLYDFETVAAHEIGHALGFYSVVDTVSILIDAGLTGIVTPSAMDLFRFADDVAGKDPNNSGQFAAFERNLVPGTDAISDFFGTEVLMSIGGAGNSQASHWRDNLGLGLMDPTLGTETISQILYNDALALDLIGYDIDMAAFTAIPEPSAVVLALISGLLIRGLRRRRHA